MQAFFVLIVFALFVLQLYNSVREDERSLFVNEDDPFDNLNGYVRIGQIPETAQLDTFLAKHFPFYALLTQNERRRFRARLEILLRSKFFIGKEGLEVHDVMILMICASMVQLTFGLDHYHFPRFRKIALFPHSFYSHLIEHEVKGLTVHYSGVVILSWHDALEGVQKPHDKLNLLLHELAHALYLDYFGHRRMLYGFDEWREAAMPEFEAMRRSQQTPFLRSYAATNLDEFWAVSVEHFFEAPEEFEARLPGLYRAMCKILKLDMAARMRLMARGEAV